ncbi:MAG TPA: hypothetical protein PLY70_14115, partial [Saprospiraceae bacterium]|nr:hypothetical protein [Saprospiraceae bacterium]
IWNDHLDCDDKSSKVEMKRVKKSSQTILVLNCDPLITATPKTEWALRRPVIMTGLTKNFEVLAARLWSILFPISI